MLRTASTDTSVRNISIITNFGCQTNCWYCIWKEHRLRDVQLETDWDRLYTFLNEHKHKGKVSVSGGGDCLFNYPIHESWWDKLFRICKKLNVIVDVHSREKFYNKEFWLKVNRCVASSDNLHDDIDYFNWLINYTKLRITHVVTSKSNESVVDEYLNYSYRTGCQFTIKQLVGHDDNGNYERFKQLYPMLFHLDTGDYNIYYMPDNTITDKFL